MSQSPACTKSHVVQNSRDQLELEALRARYVFPATSRPIPDGLVTIQGRTIVAVGKETPAGKVRDMGNVAIVPGLVNAHTHLEFSDLSEPLGGPSAQFVDWIRLVMAFRRRVAGTAGGTGMTPAPGGTGMMPVARGRGPVEAGLRECTACGTTSLGEIAQPGSSLGPFQNAPLEATVFLELIAPTARRVPATLESARQFMAAADVACGCRIGLSPHAPYSVHPELLSAVVGISAAASVPVAMHLAESREEIELLRHGSGAFCDLFRELGVWDSGSFPPNRRPLDYLETLAQAHRALVIHGNYLDDEEIAFLGAHAGRMAVVYCPRTHAHFGHAEHPLTKLLSAGATVALGTDSRASSPDLSLLAEMRFVARKCQSIRPDVVLQLGTILGARTLGRDQRLGSLEPGKYADLAAISLPDRDAADPHELLFHSDLPVVATWYRGRMIEDR